MTYFEQLCKNLGVIKGSEEEDVISNLVNNLISGDRGYTEEEVTKWVTLAYQAMTAPRRPKCYKMPMPARMTARIGRYLNGSTTDVLYRKWYVDITTPFGTDNRGVPLSFDTYDAAKSYLACRGFRAVY